MSKVYEFGFSKIKKSNTLDKLSGLKDLIDDADKMSALGWEYKGYYETLAETVVFYQREKETNQPATPSLTPAVQASTAPRA